MSRIDELISQLCSNGVEFKPLRSVCDLLNGYSFKSEFFDASRNWLATDLHSRHQHGFSSTYYSGEYSERYVVNDGNIFVEMDDDFHTARWQHGRALLNHRVCRLQGFASVMLPGFLF